VPITNNGIAFTFHGDRPLGQTGTITGDFTASFSQSGAASGSVRMILDITAYNSPQHCDTLERPFTAR
jgi:hypothetical protein